MQNISVGIHDLGQLLEKSGKELNGLLSRALNEERIACLISAAYTIQAPKAKSLLETLEEENEEINPTHASTIRDETAKYSEQNYRSTGDRHFDLTIGGGFREGALTEISGRYATGKTQIMLQCAIYTALGLTTTIEEGKSTTDRETHTTTNESLFDILQGVGVNQSQHQRSVVLITFNGESEQATLVWRMQQMCDSMIEERYLMAQQYRAMKAKEDYRNTNIPPNERQKQKRRRKGGFASHEQRHYTLQEVQELARKILLQNIDLDNPLSYNMLNHTITSKLPLRIEERLREGKPSVGLIALDDLTRVINEGADLIRGQFNGVVALARSHLCCELSDNLKRLAVINKVSQSAILAINHVIDPQDRHKEAIRAWLESKIDEMTSSTRKSITIDPTQFQAMIKPQTTPKGQDAFLNLAFQEIQFAGILANLKNIEIFKSFKSSSKAELVEDLMSETQMASMGLSWVNGINVRIMLSVSAQKVSLSPQQSFRLGHTDLSRKHLFGIRKATVILNPFSPIQFGAQSGIDYIICPSGVHSIRTLDMMGLEERVIETKDEQCEDEEDLWRSVGEEDDFNDAQWDAEMVAATQKIEEEHAMRLPQSTDSDFFV